MSKESFFTVFDDDDGPLAQAPPEADWIYFTAEEIESWASLLFLLEGPLPDILSTTRAWLLFSSAAKGLMQRFDERNECVWLPVEVGTESVSTTFWVLRFSVIHDVLHPLSYVDGKHARDVLATDKVKGLDVFGLGDGEGIAVSGSVLDAFRHAGITGGDFLRLPVR